ncbi:MAG: alginate lyase family protein [Planctomycetes bacterium]|nr:alginate lyase family protein [Planctomycetota bacterium]
MTPVRRALAPTAPLLVALLLVAAGSTPAAAQDPFAPLNLLMTERRLRELQGALSRGDPLVVAMRDQVVAEATPLLARAPDPIRGVLKVPGYYTKKRAQQQAITRRLRGDARGAHTLALAFALTGDARFADQAQRYLDAWMSSLTRPVDGGEWYHAFVLQRRGDTPIVMSYSFPAFFYAHDLLRGLGRVDAAAQARFVAWLRPFVDYHRREERYKDNHHAWQCLFLATAAHVTEDRALFAEAVARYRRAFDAQVCPDGSLGRELLRGERAATYSLMATEAMLQVVVIAERHGHANLRDLRATRTPLRLPNRARPRLFEVVDHLAWFVHDPAAWRRAHRLVLRGKQVNGPARLTDWGWCFEVAHALWGDPRHLALAGAAPYGLGEPRVYTLDFATLHFRPLPAPGLVGALTRPSVP